MADNMVDQLMDLKRLRYFCAIVEQGQISRAARVLNIAQPPLSMRLRELEAELNVELIKRGGGQWEVTEAGHRLYRKAHVILSKIEGLAEEFKAGEGAHSVANIGTSSTCASALHRPLQHLRREHPGMSVRLTVADSTELEAMLRARSIGMAVMQPPEDGTNLVLKRLMRTRFVAAVPNALIDGTWPEQLNLAHLARFPLLLLRRASGIGSYEKILHLSRSRGLELDVYMECPDVWAVREAWVALGNVVAVLPETEVVDHQPPFGEFFVLDEPDLFFEPVVAWLDGCNPTGATEILINYILEAVTSAPAARLPYSPSCPLRTRDWWLNEV